MKKDRVDKYGGHLLSGAKREQFQLTEIYDRYVNHLKEDDFWKYDYGVNIKSQRRTEPNVKDAIQTLLLRADQRGYFLPHYSFENSSKSNNVSNPDRLKNLIKTFRSFLEDRKSAGAVIMCEDEAYVFNRLDDFIKKPHHVINPPPEDSLIKK